MKARARFYAMGQSVRARYGHLSWSAFAKREWPQWARDAFVDGWMGWSHK